MFVRDSKFEEKNLGIIDMRSGEYHTFDNVKSYEELVARELLLVKGKKHNLLRIIDMKSGEYHAFNNVVSYKESKNGAFLFVKDRYECLNEPGSLRIIDVNKGKVLFKLKDIIHHTHITTTIPFREIMFSTTNRFGIFNVWKFIKNKDILPQETNTFQFLQHNAMQDEVSDKKGAVEAISFDLLTKDLYEKGFSSTYIGSFSSWLDDEEFDSEGVVMDIQEKENSNINNFDTKIYECISDLIIPSAVLSIMSNSSMKKVKK